MNGVASNPHGRAAPDRGGLGSKLVKCGKPVIFSTFNTRTLNKSGRFEELVNCAKSNNIDVICIQEHRYFHPDDELKYRRHLGYELITCSASKNKQNATVGGVGLLLSPKACSNMIQVEKISSRIIIAEFNSNPVTTIVGCYSPHNASPEEEVDKFYQDLLSLGDSIPAHNLLLICGDFNAKIGSKDGLYTFSSDTNRNGDKLIDLMSELGLVATNTRFMNPRNKLWTFQYPSGSRAQLDYILIRKKWINSVRNSRAYSSFCGVLSDHRIVSTKINLSLRCSKKPPIHPMKQIDWVRVGKDNSLSTQYALDVFNRFSELCSDDASPTDKHNLVTTCVEEVATSTLPQKTKTGFKGISSHDSVKTAHSELANANQKYENSPLNRNRDIVRKARKNLQDAYDNATADFIQGKINNITHLHTSQQHSAAWRTINEITGRKDNPTATIKGGSQEKRKEEWLNHFKKLLGESPRVSANLPKIQVAEDLNIPTKAFTMKELKSVTQRLVSKKTPGPDNIPPLIWKDENFHPLLLDICNHVYSTHDAPPVWLTSNTIPIPKKGNLTLPENYRGISLTSIAAKVYNKLILNRLVPALNPILRKNQNGFPKRSIHFVSNSITQKNC
jgi:exonuclease III